MVGQGVHDQVELSTTSRQVITRGGLATVHVQVELLSSRQVITCQRSIEAPAILAPAAVTATCRGGPIVRTYSITCLLLLCN